MKKEKNIKILKLILFTFISIICISSLFLYIETANYLDIEKIIIIQGKFNISENQYNFSFKTKVSEKYNLILTIHKDIYDDYEAFRNKLEKLDILIDIFLKDSSGFITKKSITQKNLSFCHYFEEFSLCLLAIDAVKDKEYFIQVHFKFNTDYYDRRPKALFIQRDYDFAAIPWAMDFKKILFVIFVISLIFVVAMILYYFVNKRRK